MKLAVFIINKIFKLVRYLAKLNVYKRSSCPFPHFDHDLIIFLASQKI